MKQKTPLGAVLFGRTQRYVWVGLLLVFAAVLLATSVLQPVEAATSSTINFQARLQQSNGALVPDGHYNVEFKLYSQSSGGSAVWTETRDYNGGSPDRRVRVANGYLTVNLGSVTAFGSSINWDQEHWLTMNVGGRSQTADWDGEMTPRLKLTAVPYAFSAGQLQQTNGVNTSTLKWATQNDARSIELPDESGMVCLRGSSACQFAAASGSAEYIQNNNGSPQTADFNITGTGSAGAFQAASLDRASAGTLTIGGTNATSVVFGGSSELTVDLANDSVVLGANVTLKLVGGSSLPGSPTEGMIHYDSDNDELLLWTGSAWEVLNGGSGGSDGRTATVIVAADDSPAAAKASADELADGTADQEQINDAITAAGSGGTVYLHEGTYTVDGQINLASNVTLTGAGSGTIIKVKDAHDVSLQTLRASSVTRVTISNLRIDGNKTNNSSGTMYGIFSSGSGSGSGTTAIPGVTVDNVTVENFRHDGIRLLSTVNSSIRNSTVSNSNNGGNGVYLATSSTNNVIANNLFHGNGDFGVEVASGTLNTVAGNTFRGNTDGGVRLNADYNTVTGNTIDGGTRGIELFSSSDYNTISGNTISNTSSGVYMFSTEGNVISNNTIEAASSEGIILVGAANRNNITSNMVRGGGNLGIYLAATSSGNHYNNISNNVIETNIGTGIYIYDSSNNTFNSNKLHDNTSTGSNPSIRLRGTASNNILTSNSITDPSGTGVGILIDSTTADNYLADNIISITGAASISDSSTSTIYANQLDGDGVLINRSTGYQVQDASGVNMMNIDPTHVDGSRITLGAVDSDATLLILDTKNTEGDPTGAAGAMYYNSFDGKFRCYEGVPGSGGAWTDCVGSGGGGGDVFLASNQTFTGDNIFEGTVTVSEDSATAFMVQNAAGTATLLNVDTVDSVVTIGDGVALELKGGDTASRPADPTEGMVYYDTETNRLLTYANGKWQADRSTASAIVAASDSSQTAQDSADYIAPGEEDSSGSGTGSIDGDQIVINEALSDVAASGGGTVLLLPGTYTIDASISIPNNVTLAGSGAGTLIQLGNFGSTSTTLYAIVNEDTSTGENVGIRDLKMDGRRSINTAGSQYGISLEGMGGGGGSRVGAAITGLWVTNFNQGGIAPYQSSYTTITNNVTQGNTTGITVTGETSGNNSSNNIITGNTSIGDTDYGIFLWRSSNNNVANNIVKSAPNHGISLNAATDNNVTGNNVVGATIAGFVASSSATNNRFTNNTATGSGFHGFWMNSSTSNNILSGNTSKGNDRYGIYLQASSSTVSSNIIEGNTRDGILVQTGASNNIITDNRIHNNGGSNSDYHGIHLDTTGSAPQNNTITNNYITDTSGGARAINIISGVLDTYLSNNRFGTGANGVWNGSGPINDAGTDTIYSNQVGNDGAIVNRNSDGFVIQDATGGDLLRADVGDGMILIGEDDADTILFVLDRSSSETDPATAPDGSMYYNTDMNEFRCRINGEWENCGGTSGGDNFKQDGNAFGDTAVLGTTDDYGIDFITNENVVLSLSNTGEATFNSADSANAFRIQNSAGTTTLFNVDTIDNIVSLGEGVALEIQGGDTASRPSSPTEGMVYYDNEIDRLLTYSNGKWQADRSTASKIVAASNSMLKEGADYVADGTGDQSEINSALTAVGNAGGGMVYLMEGTYTINASISIPNNVTLTGAGSGTIITLPTNIGSMNMIVNSNTTTGTRVTVSNLTIDGNSANQSSGTINGIYFNNLGEGSIHTGTEGGTVTNTTIRNIRSVAIRVESSNNHRITGNYFVNNNIHIEYEAGAYTSISGNSMNGSTGSAIYIYNSSNNITINGNNMQGVGGDSVLLDNSVQNTITANNISATAGGSYGGGSIELVNNSDTNVVSGNKVHNVGYGNFNGIIIAGSSNNSITGNDLTDNNCGSGANTCYAITIDSSSASNYLSNNRFTYTGTESPAPPSISDASSTTIYANQIKEVGGKLINKTSDGFQIQNASGANLLQADSSANTITIGESDSGTLLVLNTKDTTGHPTAVEGAMYYNSADQKFWCYVGTPGVDGDWVDCIGSGGGGGGDVTAAGDNTFTGTNTFRNTADSQTAFRIQNASSVSLLTVDTLNGVINTQADLNLGTTFGNRLFSDDFESGNVYKWDSTSISTGTNALSIQDSTKRNGKYAAEFDPESGSTYANMTKSFEARSTVYARAWVNIASTAGSAPTGNVTLMSLRPDGANFGFSVYRSTTGQICVWNNHGGGFIGSCSAASTLPTSTWGLLEVRTTIDAGGGGSDTNDTVQVWLNGTQIVSAIGGVNGANLGTANHDTIQLGDFADRTYTMYIDDVAVSDAPTGNSSSLNVSDSLHVAGTSSFDGLALFQDQILARNRTDLTSALQVQNASGTSLFNVDTLNNTVTIGESDSSTLLVLNTKDTTGHPTAVEGAMYYNSDDEKFWCYVGTPGSGGAWTDCIGAGGGGGGDVTAAGNNTFTGTNTFRNTSTTAFRIQNASSADLLVADTSAMTITIGNGTDGVVLSASGLELIGDARYARQIILTPEYAGAVLDGTGTGQMTAGHDSGKNYYEWTTSETSGQSYSVIVTYQLPSDWDEWATTSQICVDTYRGSGSSATGTMLITDAGGTPEGSGISTTPSGTVWDTTCTSSLTETYANNDVITIKLTMTADSDDIFWLGNITINYLSNGFKQSP